MSGRDAGSNGGPKAPGRSNWRTREIEEFSNLYLIHPASALLTAVFARWGWSPNAVSVLGMVSAFVAAVCFYHYRSTMFSLLGMVFMVGWHILDGADGQLARMTGKTSRLGKVIDGVCDHLGFGMVYVALGLALQTEHGAWVWLLAVAAGLSHLIQAGALEFHRDCFDCWVRGKTGNCVPPLDDISLDYGSGPLARALRAVHLLYIRLQYLTAEADETLIIGERRARGKPEAVEFQKICRRPTLRSVRQWTWLSANKRTIAVSLFCLAKAPMLFFLYEIIVLNGVLLWLRTAQRRTNGDLREALARYADRTVDPTPC
jgi:hypothetical protein